MILKISIQLPGSPNINSINISLNFSAIEWVHGFVQPTSPIPQDNEINVRNSLEGDLKF